MKIYAGNLPFDMSAEDLLTAFQAYGKVDYVHVIYGEYRRMPRGFAFITMPYDEQALEAIEALNEKEFMGRNIFVEEARS